MTTDTLWYSTCPGPSAVSIAGQLGWLADEFAPDGLAVRTLASLSGSPRRIHAAHQLVPQPDLPYLVRHGGNPPPLVGLSRGVDLRIVGLTWTEGARRVLALEDSGLRTPRDLEGRRLAVPHRAAPAVDYVRSVALRTYAEALASADLTLDDVELVEIDAGGADLAGPDATGTADVAPTATLGGARFNASAHRNEALALVRREVDVVAAEHSGASHLQATLRLRTVFDTALSATAEGRASGDQPLVLTTTGALLAERPDVVARWIARALDAADWAREHRAQARRLIARDAGLAEDLVDDAFSPAVLQQLAIDLDERSIAALRVQHDHLLAHGFLDGPVEIERFVDPAPLAAAHELRAARSSTAVAV
jgi:ABC-type nitrate/sulfonate/bicarbonate transport system substrate-binding protein